MAPPLVDTLYQTYDRTLYRTDGSASQNSDPTDVNNQLLAGVADGGGSVEVSPDAIGNGVGAGTTIMAAASMQVGMNTPNDGNTGFWLGTVNGVPQFAIGSALNYLFWSGTGLTVVGAITATSGTIGGFTISATSLLAGAGATRIQLDTTAGIWLGATTFGAAPFSVSLAGALTATNATISGSVTATTGTIGGFSIGSDYIRDAANSMGMASTVTGGDDVRFWAGDTFANRATAPFRVTEAGAVTGSSITITGGSITSTPISAIPNSTATDITLLEKTHNITFSVTDADTIAWSSGTINMSNGRSFSISAGNTGNMAALTYIYLDTGVSSTVLQTTTTYSTAIGANKMLLGSAQNNTVTASFIPYGPGQMLVDGANIGALSIVAGNIAASTITAAKMSVSQLSAITADLGAITAGSIVLPSGGFIRSGQTAYNTGTGFYLGNDSGTPKFSIGSTSNYLTWDGTNLGMYSNLADAITLDRGSNMLLKEGGNLNFTSVTVAGACTAALVATGTGNVDNGAHTYKVEFVTATGGTGIATAVASNTVTVDGTHKQVSLTGIPVSSSGAVTSRKIYRTTVAGTYLLLTTIADNVTTTYTDNTADASMTGSDAGAKQNSTFGKVKIDGISSLNLGISNTSAGQSAGTATTTGYGVTAFGWSALTNNTSGYNNTAVGTSAMPANTTGYENTAMGSSSMNASITGRYNAAFGYFTLYYGTAMWGCTAIGYSSAFNTTGNYNTALGWEALYQNTSGTNNVALGVLSLYTTTGSSNIGLGYAAGYQATTSNELYVDNQTRASNAVEKTNSIIYGVMDATNTNQKLYLNATVFPIQATTAGAPAYVKGGMYFDTTLNKMRIGGATNWETITSV